VEIRVGWVRTTVKREPSNGGARREPGEASTSGRSKLGNERPAPARHAQREPAAAGPLPRAVAAGALEHPPRPLRAALADGAADRGGVRHHHGLPLRRHGQLRARGRRRVRAGARPGAVRGGAGRRRLGRARRRKGGRMSAAGTRLRLVGPAPVDGALLAGAAVVDGRTPQAFDAGHLPGAVNVPAGAGAGELAAIVLSRDEPVLALAARLEEAGELAAELEAAGFRE